VLCFYTDTQFHVRLSKSNRRNGSRFYSSLTLPSAIRTQSTADLGGTFGEESKGISFARPYLASFLILFPFPAPVPRCYEVEMTRGLKSGGSCRSYHGTSCLLSSLFLRFPILSLLFTPNARLFPHLVLLASPFIHLPLYRSALHHPPGVDRDTINIYIDRKWPFFLLASVYFPLLICALFIFGNRLFKNNKPTPTPTRAREPCEPSGTILESRF